MSDARAFLDHEVVHRIDQLHDGVSARQRELLRDVAELDRREHWKKDGCRDMSQWVSGRFGISNWAARRWIVAAHALERLPLISQALSNGTLCLDKVLELVRYATPDTEERLLGWAQRVSVAAIRRHADRANRPALEDIRDSERSRFLRWWWFDDGKRFGLYGELSAADGAAVSSALERVAERLPELRDDEADGAYPLLAEDRLEQRRADALVSMASTAIADDPDPDRATVVVHTSLGAWLDETWSEIADGPVLHPDVARRLACDARLQLVLDDPERNPLGIGRTSRNIPPWLMRALRFRDHGCTFPGCDARSYLKGHHIIHWEDGGRPTSTTSCSSVTSTTSSCTSSAGTFASTDR